MLVNEEILGLEVSVEYAMSMAVQQARVELMCEFLSKRQISHLVPSVYLYQGAVRQVDITCKLSHSASQRARRLCATHLDDLGRDGCPIFVAHFHVPLQVNIQKFKHQIQFLVCMNDIEKPGDDVNGGTKRCAQHVSSRDVPDDVIVL